MSIAAMGGAKGQVGRLLTLVPYLYAHGDVRLDEAARELGIGESQLVKDLRVLFMCGLPGGFPDDLIDVDIDALTEPDGDRVIRISNADYLARPLRLTPTEATAVIVALRALRSGAVSEATREVVDRTLAKLEQAAAEGAAASIDPGEQPVDRQLVETHAALTRAIDQQRQARIVYWVPARDEESSRVVDPRALVSNRDIEYLDAWCHSAEAPRSFRLDRIRSVEVLDAPVTETAEQTTDDDVLDRDNGGTVVRIRLAPEARWVSEYYSVIDPVPLPDGGLEVGLKVFDPRWLVRLLLRLAPYAAISEGSGSEEFTEMLMSSAKSALGYYGRSA